MAFFNTLKTKLLKLNKKSEAYQEAITFSQANLTPSQENHTMACSEDTGRNIMVACNTSQFPEAMISYALEMAQRMDYGIIAVNAANLTRDVTDFFSTTHEELYRDFKETAIKNVQSFRSQATKQGLKFAHTTKFSTIDNAIEDITKECGLVEFVISENREYVEARGHIENRKNISQQLCVYSVN